MKLDVAGSYMRHFPERTGSVMKLSASKLAPEVTLVLNPCVSNLGLATASLTRRDILLEEMLH